MNNLQISFGYAYYQYLKELAYKDLMIDCGVKALESNFFDESLCQLAGADDENEQEVLRLFRESAEIIGLSIPTKEEETVWLIKIKNKLKQAGHEVELQHISNDFDDNLHLIHHELKSLKLRELDNFLTVYEKYIYSTIEGHYDYWLENIESASKAISSLSKDKNLIKTAVDIQQLFHDFAYGGIEKCHLEASQDILEAIEEIKGLA